MIIVSQDKKKIVENLNLGISKPGEYNRNYVIYNTEIGEELGEYKTEERAKEVLQEIIKVYIESKKAQETTSMFGFSTIPSNTYYEMPKEW